MSSSTQTNEMVTAVPSMEDARNPTGRNARISLWILGAIGVATLTLAFVLLWWNRSLGEGSDGVLFYMGERILAGKVPYRDFYLVTPPWTAFKSAAMILLTGDHLITVRALAIFERVSLAVVVYIWLARLFAIRYAIVASFVSIVVFSGDIADALACYTCDSSLWAIMAGLCASISIPSKRPAQRFILLLLSGLFAGMVFLTKQTTGLGATLIIPLVVGTYLLGKREWTRALVSIAAIAVGWLVPISTLLTWLYRHQALPQFIDQTFRSGPSSKGPLPLVLARPLISTFTNSGSLIIAILAVIVMAGTFLAWRRSRQTQATEPEGTKPVAVWIFIAALFLGGGILLSRVSSFDTPALAVLRMPQLTTAYIALIVPAVLFARLAWQSIIGTVDDRDAEMFLLSGMSLTLAYMYSLSWTPYEAMALPGVGLALCLAFSGLGKIGGGLLMAASMAAVSASIALKLMVPFTWVNWSEPAVQAPRSETTIPGLRGFDLSAEANAKLERLVGAIERYSSPSDPVFVFPYYAQLYVLSHRNPPTFAYAHWLDVVPDKQARKDADTVRRTRPAVLLFLDIPSLSFVGGEGTFRAGRSSGQTYMLQTLRSMAPSYTLVDSVPAGIGENILVYARSTEQPRNPNHDGN